MARERVLTLGMRTADGAVEVQQRASRPGEMLVVRGAEALRDGAAVEVESARARHGREPARAGAPEKLAP